MKTKWCVGVFVLGIATMLASVAVAVELPVPVIHLAMDGNLANTGSGSYAINLVAGSSGLSTAYVTGRDGTANGALRLNNIDSGTTIANGAGNNIDITYKLPDTGTIALWYYKMNTVGNDNGSYYQELFCNSAGGDKWEGWTSVSHNDMGVRINDDEWGRTGDNTVFTDSLGWHHLAFTWERGVALSDTVSQQITDPVTRSIYIDGVLATSGTHTGTVTENWFEPGSIFAIGGNHGNTCANGAFDDVRIYTSALTASQVNSLVPEPGTFVMLIAGLIGAIAYAMRKRK